jgi:type II secretory pathway pseudopilin PulG
MNNFGFIENWKLNIENSRLRRDGFTLIELIIYLAIVTLFLTSIIFFSWDIIYGREKAVEQQSVEQNGRIAMGRIAYEIRKAANIISVGSNQIVLNSGGANTTIGLVSGKIQITDSSGGPYSLTSNQVEVTRLVFTNLTPPGNNSKNIKIDVTVQQSSNIKSAQGLARADISQSVELKGQFNQGRKLLINGSSSSLANGNRRVENVFLNSSTGTITIDKMVVLWTGGSVGSVLQGIIINGVTVWTGSAVSGTVIDITNTGVLTTDNLPLVLGFSSKMDNSTMVISFIMADGSTASLETVFGVAPTAAPTATPTPVLTPTSTPPTPTPTPANCNQFCQQKWSLPGACRKSNACSGHNEGRIYECRSPNICCCQ